jgi:hypothetical protein
MVKPLSATVAPVIKDNKASLDGAAASGRSNPAVAASRMDTAKDYKNAMADGKLDGGERAELRSDQRRSMSLLA